MLGVCYTFISSRYQWDPEGPEHMVDRDKTKILMLWMNGFQVQHPYRRHCLMLGYSTQAACPLKPVSVV